MEINLKDEIGKGTVVLGTKEVLRGIKTDSFKTIIIASNCPETVKEQLEHYAKISEIGIEMSESTGKQLGITCGKPFGVAVIGVKK
jgi:large subunit ribosomal protein L30e